MVTTVITEHKRVTLPDDIREELGLEDGVEYVAERTGDVVLLRPSEAAVRLSYPSLGDRLSEDQVEALEQVDLLYGSLARYRTGPVLSRAEEREAFERAVADENAPVSRLAR